MNVKHPVPSLSLYPTYQLPVSAFPALLNNLLPFSFTDNLREGAEQKVVFITGRVHPGETPSSFVCQGELQNLMGILCLPPTSNWGTVMASGTVWSQAESLSRMRIYFISKEVTPISISISFNKCLLTTCISGRMNRWMDGWMGRAERSSLMCVMLRISHMASSTLPSLVFLVSRSLQK